MGEEFPTHDDQQHTHEHARVNTVEQVRITAAESEHKQSKPQHEASKHIETDPLLHSLNALKARAEQEAQSSKEFDVQDVDDGASTTHAIIMHRELKEDAYRRSLEKARRELPATDRIFSRFIHQPTVELVSNIAAHTVGRPSGLCMGGLLALISSSLLLYMARTYGFAYNYSVMILGLVGGFIIGIALESCWRLIRHRSSLD